MVHYSTRFVKLPHSNSTLYSHNSKMRGTGNGSVLLRTAGGGAGSSYQDMDDYIRTTGIDPYKRRSGTGIGDGMRSLGDKLSKLSIAPTSAVRKNIVMNM